MPKIRIGIALIYLGVLLSSGIAVGQELPRRTPLDDYVEAPDSSYRWKIVERSSSRGMTTIVVDLTSQTWRRASEVSQPIWRHWLILSIPARVSSETGMLWIGGGTNGGAPPKSADERMAAIARATHSVVAELKMIPNQPLVFHGDGVKRVEDDLIAYTWDQFLRTGDPTWPARNPMVKSAVRAMDTITALTKEEELTPKVTKFVVAGGSKRGWTTWLTGAVDKRVVGIAPIVIDVLNVNANAHHHFAAYGFWAPAVGSYVEHGIMGRLQHARMPALLRLVDPWFYRHRLKMPKLIINASGDQFFPPDSSQYYFKDLVGPKYLRYVPNADHSLKGTDAIETLIAWYSLILLDRERPQFRWEIRQDGALVVTAQDKPKEVRLWSATNPDARDFRLETLGPKYESKRLEELTDGVYVAKLPSPEKGWTAYFVELTYDCGLPVPLKVTTTVQVTPDRLPFKDKDLNLPPTISIRCIAGNREVITALRKADAGSAMASVAADLFVSERKLPGDADRVELHVNWKPVGRFEASAEAMAAWLTKQGCERIRFRLEAGANHRSLE